MTLYADAWFARGHSHRVCEDYAVAQVSGAGARAVLSDGCSASPDTDLGARLLTRAALRGEVAAAADHAALLGLPVESLDATLAQADADDEGVRVRLHGDGVVAVRRAADAALAIWRVRYPSGAPAYPAHGFAPSRLDPWRAAFGDAREIQHTPFEGPETIRCAPGTTPLEWAFDWAEVDLVALFSDGVEAFDTPAGGETHRSRAPVPAAAVLAELMRVHHPHTPRFAERRLRRFLTRTCPRRGWRPFDDISVAMIARGRPCD